VLEQRRPLRVLSEQAVKVFPHYLMSWYRHVTCVTCRRVFGCRLNKHSCIMSGSTARRRQRLFVDVPPSPFPLSRYSSLSLKENTPLIANSVLFRKRKRSDSVGTPADSPRKWQKIVNGATRTSITSVAPIPSLVPANVSVGFPNGFIRCHQCAQYMNDASLTHRSLIFSPSLRALHPEGEKEWYR